jgi:hypothetical protein
LYTQTIAFQKYILLNQNEIQLFSLPKSFFFLKRNNSYITIVHMLWRIVNTWVVTHKMKGFDSCTTPIQQLYNNSSHEGGPQYVGPTLM